MVPAKSLPVATSPAWGSKEISVTIRETGPLGSHSSMAFPSGFVASPCQITLIRRFWESFGFGRCLTTMSSTTSQRGLRFARFFISPVLQLSYTSLKETPLFFMNGTETAQL
ncbi:MAG: hypothetical protein A4E38_00246 [Methanoregulaceae archaeon PtaB.Bin108]|nr:MAG: hypothetical protein A4E38_00246 [Methanoregulaceae archaeon PtaB.Bin108]